MAERLAPAHRGQVLVEAQALVKRYGSLTAVDNLSLSLRAGEIFGLLGPNGAGKSTTVRLLLGLSQPEAGLARVLGLSPLTESLELKRQVGWLPENVGFYWELTARQNLNFTAELNGLCGRLRDERVALALERLALTPFADQPAGALSRGMRQRLGLAELLVKDPCVLFLDEPTLGLDPAGLEEIMALLVALAAEGRAILICSHLLPLVESLAHRVGFMRAGRLLASGAPSDLAGGNAGSSLAALYRRYLGGEP